ncbi:MAG: hypothetical protein LUH22_10105 [Bacteroides sp.]|nr:hypothetical protein [Bacteroides sp.]
MKETISIRLFKTLLKGKEQLSEQAVERVSRFVLSQRTDEGSFTDKSGKADLYYTAFGWMLSYVLGIPSDSRKMNDYLATLDTDRMDLIHYAAYVRCRMIQQLFEKGKLGLFIKSFFSTSIPSPSLKDFNGLPHNDPQSPYSQFIWLALLEDTGKKFKVQRLNQRQSDRFEPEKLNTEPRTLNLELYHAPGGGYMNTTDGLTATTNATVAALAVKGQMEGYKDNVDIRFLYNLQESSGGFAAAKASPLPDLLSTATSLFMLNCYGIKPKYAARDFIEAHWLDSGGFAATLLDDKSDVEYTFYGLLGLGTLNFEH